MAKNGSRARSNGNGNGNGNGSGNGHDKPGSVYTFPGVSNHDIRRVAVHAMCDPRCVVKYLRGMKQPETIRARVASALTACGMAQLVGSPDERLERVRNVASLGPGSTPPPSR